MNIMRFAEMLTHLPIAFVLAKLAYEICTFKTMQTLQEEYARYMKSEWQGADAVKRTLSIFNEGKGVLITQFLAEFLIALSFVGFGVGVLIENPNERLMIVPAALVIVIQVVRMSWPMKLLRFRKLLEMTVEQIEQVIRLGELWEQLSDLLEKVETPEEATKILNEKIAEMHDGTSAIEVVGVKRKS